MMVNTNKINNIKEIIDGIIENREVLYTMLDFLNEDFFNEDDKEAIGKLQYLFNTYQEKKDLAQDKISLSESYKRANKAFKNYFFNNDKEELAKNACKVTKFINLNFSKEEIIKEMEISESKAKKIEMMVNKRKQELIAIEQEICKEVLSELYKYFNRAFFRYFKTIEKKIKALVEEKSLKEQRELILKLKEEQQENIKENLIYLKEKHYYIKKNNLIEFLAFILKPYDEALKIENTTYDIVADNMLKDINGYDIDINNKNFFEKIVNIPIPILDVEYLKDCIFSGTTNYPYEYITPTDITTKTCFKGDFPYGETQNVCVGKIGNKKINNTVGLNIVLDGISIDIKSNKKLDIYDRVIHDAITTLFIEGNKYITPQMIYQVISGDQNARLTEKELKRIRESITKCIDTSIVLNRTAENKIYGDNNQESAYKGNIISGEMVLAQLNGSKVECLNIFREPILYDLANQKNQIGRTLIEYQNTPLYKNKETILLQNYLKERILGIKGKNKLNNIILYKTIYEKMDILTLSEASKKKKKMKIRNKVRIILDYWKEKGFIKNYCENKKKKTFYNIIIDV